MKLANDIKCPVLIVHGNKDKSLKIEHSQKFFSLLNEAKEFVTIDGAGHHFENADEFEKLIDSVVKFFVRVL